MSKEIDWLQMAKELKAMSNGIAVLRVLQAHGVTHLVKFKEPGDSGLVVKQSNSIESVISSYR